MLDFDFILFLNLLITFTFLLNSNGFFSISGRFWGILWLLRMFLFQIDFPLLDFLGVFVFVLIHFFVISFSGLFSLNLVRFFLRSGHVPPNLRCILNKLSTVGFFKLVSKNRVIFPVKHEETTDWGFRPVVFSVWILSSLWLLII